MYVHTYAFRWAPKSELTQKNFPHYWGSGLYSEKISCLWVLCPSTPTPSFLLCSTKGSSIVAFAIGPINLSRQEWVRVEARSQRRESSLSGLTWTTPLRPQSQSDVFLSKCKRKSWGVRVSTATGLCWGLSLFKLILISRTNICTSQPQSHDSTICTPNLEKHHICPCI
jgi:hypothetical protein